MSSPCSMCGGIGISFCKECDIYQGKYIKSSVLEDIKAEIKEWYWQADKQAIAKDPCVVDAMVDLFIRTINNHMESEDNNVETI